VRSSRLHSPPLRNGDFCRVKEHTPSREASSCTANQAIPTSLRNPDVQYCLHMSASLVLIQSQMNPSERPPQVGEGSAKFCSAAYPLRPYSRFSRPEPLLFLTSSSSIVLTRLSGARSRPTTQKMVAPGMEPGPLDCGQEL
jgi:hypothetical protein